MSIKLIKVANALDYAQCYKEANFITEGIKKIATNENAINELKKRISEHVNSSQNSSFVGALETVLEWMSELGL